jgi:hypothetical protein
VQHPSAALYKQDIHMQRSKDAEIEELKQSLRYVEIQLAKSKEDKESLELKLKK